MPTETIIEKENQISVSFYSKIGENNFYYESKVSDQDSFMVLKDEQTFQTCTPVVNQIIPIIRKSITKSSKRYDFLFPVMIDHDEQDIRVLSPEEYVLCKEENVEVKMFRIVEDLRSNLMSYLNSPKFQRDDRFVLLEEY